MFQSGIARGPGLTQILSPIGRICTLQFNCANKISILAFGSGIAFPDVVMTVKAQGTPHLANPLTDRKLTSVNSPRIPPRLFLEPRRRAGKIRSAHASDSADEETMHEQSSERSHMDFQMSLANLFAALLSPEQPPAAAPPNNSGAVDRRLA